MEQNISLEQFGVSFNAFVFACKDSFNAELISSKARELQPSIDRLPYQQQVTFSNVQGRTGMLEPTLTPENIGNIVTFNYTSPDNKTDGQWNLRFLPPQHWATPIEDAFSNQRAMKDFDFSAYRVLLGMFTGSFDKDNKVLSVPYVTSRTTPSGSKMGIIELQMHVDDGALITKRLVEVVLGSDKGRIQRLFPQGSTMLSDPGSAISRTMPSAKALAIRLAALR